MNAIVALIALNALAPQPAVTVSFKLEPGARLVYKASQQGETEAMGTTMSMKSSQTQIYEATEVEDGWIRMHGTLSEFSLDSDSPMGDMMGDPSGLETSFLVSGDRKVKEFKVTSNGKLNGDQAAGFRSSLESESASGLDGLVLPKESIAVGSKWEHELPPVSMAFGGMKSTSEGKLKALYTVLSIDGSGNDQTVTIESKTDGSYTLAIESPNGDFDFDVTQKETRTYVVRVRDGVVTKMTVESNRSMSSQMFDTSSKSKGSSELVSG